MILESLNMENKAHRMVHVLHPNKGDLGLIQFKGYYSLGRGQDCDIKCHDISVSRCHCQIVFKNGQFFLQDKQSKFGTLILTHKRTEIVPETTIAMQIGRSMVIFRTNKVQKKPAKAGIFFSNQAKHDVKQKKKLIKEYQNQINQQIEIPQTEQEIK